MARYKDGDKIRVEKFDTGEAHEGYITLDSNRGVHHFVDNIYLKYIEIFEEQGYTVTILKVAPVKLPTEPGLYNPGVIAGKTGVESVRFLLLNTHGQWSWLDFTTHREDQPLQSAENHVEGYAKTMFRVFPNE